MLFGENVLVALAGLRANLMRAILTMLGIIIGITAVIAIMTVGNSITQMVNSTMQGLGANNLQIGVVPKSYDVSQIFDDSGEDTDDFTRTMREDDYINNEMLVDLIDRYNESFKYVLFEELVSDSCKISNLGKSSKVSLSGFNKGKMDFEDKEIVAGRGFHNSDYEEGRMICLISDKVLDKCYKGDESKVLNKDINVYYGNEFQTFTVVGVYKYVETSLLGFSGGNSSTPVYIPYKTARNIKHTKNDGYLYFSVVTNVGVDNAFIAEDIQKYLNNCYYSRNDSYKIMVYTAEGMMQSLTSMLNMIGLAVAVIAAISLIVGGIGVMNIMMVSITERTKEIGTRKALGATNSSIRLQFITESVVICLIGGAIGILFGVILGSIIVGFMGYEAKVSISSVFIAFGFSMAIGIFFGYYPANKAAKLNPIEALRYE